MKITLTGMCGEHDCYGDQRYCCVCGRQREHDDVGRSNTTTGPGAANLWATRKCRRICCCESYNSVLRLL